MPGFNFDEIAIVGVAKSLTIKEMLFNIANLDYHAPLYYFIVRIFVNLKFSWIYLRLLNLLISLINVFVFYKIAKLLNNKKSGLIAALMLAICHLHITTTSLVKFYCLCFLLFSAGIYYFIKILKLNKGFCKFAFVNSLYILTNTFAFIFVLIEYFVLFFAVRKNNTSFKRFLFSLFFSLFSFLIYLPIFINQYKLSKETIISSHFDFVRFAPYSLYNFFNDYFSPLVNHCCNYDTLQSYGVYINVIQGILQGHFDCILALLFLIFSFIPVAFALYIVICKIKKFDLSKYLLLLAFFILAFYAITSIFFEVGFVPLYIYPSGIIFLLLFSLSISCIENKLYFWFVISFYLFINLVISNFYPLNERDYRTSKYNYGLEKYIQNNKIDKSTPFILTSGARFLKIYYSNLNIIDYDDEQMSGMNGKNKVELLLSDDNNKYLEINKDNISDLLIEKIKQDKINYVFEQDFKNKVLKGLNRGDKVIIGFSAQNIPIIISMNAAIKAINENNGSKKIGWTTYAMLSYAYQNLLNLLDKYFYVVKIERYTRTLSGDYILSNDKFDNNDSVINILQKNTKSWIFVTYKKK